MLASGDRIRLRRVIKNNDFVKDAANRRRPRVGDEVVVREVLGPPLGYKLECCNGLGAVEWVLSFAAEEFEWESIA